jgi:hypothetical protein
MYEILAKTKNFRKNKRDYRENFRENKQIFVSTLVSTFTMKGFLNGNLLSSSHDLNRKDQA